MLERKGRGSRPSRGREPPRVPERTHEGTRSPFTFAFKLQVVQAIVEKGSTASSVCRVFGLSTTTVGEWVRAYREQGADALKTERSLGRKPPTPTRVAQRDAVVAMRTADPELGTRRIRDLLARVEALGVSESTVRRILHEAGLIEPRPRVRAA